MRPVRLAVATIAVLTSLTLNPADARPQPQVKPYDECATHFTRHQFHVEARRAFADQTYSKAERRHLRTVIYCQRRSVSARIAKRVLPRYKSKWRQRVELERITPYPGPNGTRWAIPYSIVNCESHGSWSAYNPSGARGPYQLLGWPVPWPVRTAADRLAHHRMAARVFAGGRGRSNWVC